MLKTENKIQLIVELPWGSKLERTRTDHRSLCKLNCILEVITYNSVQIKGGNIPAPGKEKLFLTFTSEGNVLCHRRM